jgi:dolichol kinase
MSPEAIRRILHASSASVLLFAHFGSVGLLRITLVCAAAIALLLDSLRISRPAFGFFLANLVPVFRPSESKRLSGATWLCLGYAATALCPMPAATSGILVGAFADPAAALIGSRFGAKGLRKTWAGSAAAASVAAIVLVPIGIPLVAIAAGSATAMLLERWPGPLNDNLVVSPGVAFVVLFLL